MGTRWALAAFLAVVAVVGLARVVGVFNENVSWDEFALLQRAEVTHRTGEIQGGGRPGLGSLALVPFAAECRNAVDALVDARILWTGVVVVAAVAFWLLLRGVVLPADHRWLALSTGLGLWILAPPFLRYSVQVRTDQPAILFGLLGGLTLLASRRRPLLAAGSGLLMGIGFLFSQKLAYVGALVGVLAVGQLVMRGEWRPRREALRALLAGAGFLLSVVGYREIVRRLYGDPTLFPLAAGTDAFEFYREFVGWRNYRLMLPVLIPQLLVIGCLFLVTMDWLRNRGRHGRELAIAWLVLLVGVGVLLFHAARLPYFYLVLGLFPATVGALVIGPFLDRVSRFTPRFGLLVLVWVPLTSLGLMEAAVLTVDTQRQQRESIAFVERNFPRDARGFEARGAFACRHDPDPFRVRFSHQVWSEFGGEQASDRAEELLAEFRSRPVAFMMLPVPEEPFPHEVWEFWATRYVQYHGAVRVPGRVVSGGPGWTGSFEAVAPGQYVWRSSSDPTVRLEIDGHEVRPGTAVLLEAGSRHVLRLPDGGDGMLVLLLPEPPSSSSLAPFYLGAS